MLRPSIGADASSRFRIISPLGSGSYGAVHEAVDLRTGQHVAIKELQEVDAESITRFKQEFRTLADRHHPNLVGLKELIEEEGRWLLVMELVAGQDLLEYVRGDADNDNAGMARVNEARLRTALRGMAEGLVALHGYGVLHRDLKPSNVRVTPTGRAVLLDFGLVTPIDSIDRSLDAVVGTVGYMAPEQATQRNVGPKADWYAFGTCLFELLTGRHPFEAETAVQLLMNKAQFPAPRPSSLVSNVPPDLDALCVALLERNPEERPSASEILTALGADHASGGAGPILSGAPAAPAFAGRDVEIQLLERALARTHHGELKIVLIEGESGVGKSELTVEFLRRTRVHKPTLITLHGRCYENEQVSYKAFDGCIDDLSRLLREMGESDCAALLPPRAAVLGQLFPVLRTIAAITKAPRTNIAADLTARRLEAFGALTALLSKLAEERPLVLAVDDLQWADSESFRLMQALVEHAQPPPILILATIRPREELDADVRAQVETIRSWTQTDVIQLVGLPPGQAESLAAKLLSPSVPTEWLRTIASESEGHPLFLSELVQFARSHDFENRGAVTLEAALRARIERLDKRARSLLEMIALAARPYGVHIFARALNTASVEETARALLASKLLRLRRGHELGVYHDRIRHTAVSLIARSRLPGLHRQLAHALAEDVHADISEQALHWDLAGAVDQAIDAYTAAARSAFDALAFLRAAQLCARALELIGDASDPRFDTLTLQRAEALACAGQSAQAAVYYQQAADRAEGESRLRLRSRVAQQLMLSADMKRGFEAARTLLRELGVSVPVKPLAVLLRVMLDRIWLGHFARNLRLPLRDPNGRGTPRDVLTYDLVDQLLNAVAILHPPAFIMLTVNQIKRGLRCSLPTSDAQVHSIIGWFRLAAGGALQSSLPLFEAGRKLTAEINDPVLTARQAYIEGSARLAGADWVDAIACLERAHELAQAHARDNPALINDIRYHLGNVWYTIGEYARLAREMDLWLADARERNDRRSLALLTGMGHGFFRRLMRGQPELAREELESTVLAVPAEPFSFVHFGYTMGMLIVLLSQGGALALNWLDEQKKVHQRAMLMRLGMGKRAIMVFRGLALLSACVTAPERERAQHLREIEKLAPKLARFPAPYATAYAQLMLAQVAAVRGERERAIELAMAARARAEAAGISAARSCSYLVAFLRDGHDRSEEAQAIVRYFREQGFVDPMRMILTSLPVLPLLSPTNRRQLPSTSLLFQRYDVLAPRGGGGFGQVTEARDMSTDRRVALKELTSETGRSIERFKHEFRALQDIHHENLVRLDALFEHSGRFYIAMELVDGTDLLGYVRPDDLLAEERLREAFAGATQGLAALHAAGFVHRDVTPDNVMVTAEGRAVLLDYGLVARIDDARDASPVGTPLYAAPEQLEGENPHPRADVYALCVCLYQALRGVPPFSGNEPAVLLRAKKGPAPPLPRTTRTLEPIAALCMRGLSKDPTERPALAELHAALRGARTETEIHVPLPDPAEHSGRFTGRERELAQLAEAFERTPDDGLTIALVEGESGVGKSALVTEFSAQVEANFPRLLVLRGRCYENEQVALKAFDGAVDQLAQALRTLPSPECEALLPKKAALLGQLFPVLTSVPAIAEAPRKGLPAEPLARRHAAIASFVELLERLTERYELLFVIDDLHWADPESFRLLRLLVERRQALPMLLVCTMRAASAVATPTATELATLRAHKAVQSIVLEGLSDVAITLLATSLYGAALPADRLEHLVRESKGHPLFLRELVEQAKSGVARRGASTLDQALRSRFASFNEQARTLLSLVALGGRPYGMRTYARAMDRHELPRDALVALLSRGFLRRGSHDELSCYHDRIRQVVVDQLSPVARRELSRRLASSLDPDRSVDAAERARLWDEAGDAERAIMAYEQAGAHAAEALAFAHSESHYARALALLGDATKDPRHQRLSVQHGHALARVGRSADAARTFQAAATKVSGEAAVSLRILAAQHLIQSAQVEEGLSAARALLAELNVAAPPTPYAALMRLAWDRSVLAIRGLEVAAGTEAPSAATRMRLEAAWSLALPLSWLDPLGSAAVSTQHLRMALSAGELSHVARSLTEEAFTRAVQNPNDPHTDVLIGRARALAGRKPAPALEAVIAFREGAIASYRWQLEEACVLLEHGLGIVTERCPEEAWLRTNIRSAIGVAWANTGHHARLAAASTAWIAEAEERDDKFALTVLSGLGLGIYRHLMNDAPEAGLAEIERYLAPWPREPFSFAHFGEFLGLTYTFFYQGGDRALRWLDREMPRFQRSFLFRTALGKSSLLYFHIVALFHALRGATPAEAPALVARVRSDLSKLERLKSAFATNVVPGVHLALAAVDGRTEEALQLVRQIRENGEQTSHFLSIHSPLYLEGVLEGGDSGREKCARSLAPYQQQGWKEPRRGLTMFTPVIDIIADRQR